MAYDDGENDPQDEERKRQAQMNQLQAGGPINFGLPAQQGSLVANAGASGPKTASAAAAPSTYTPPPDATAPRMPRATNQNPLELIKQFQGEVQSNNATPDAIQEIVKRMNAAGVAASVGTHAGGSQLSTDKIVLPDGTYYDVQNDQGWMAPGGNPLHWDPKVNVGDASGKLQSYADFLGGQGLQVPKFIPRPGDGLPMPNPQYLQMQAGQADSGQNPYATSDTLQQILAELQAAQQGESSPRQRQAQINQLQGGE